MSRGRHAAADGSFGRSAGSAALRGGVLIAAAVLLGIVLLQATDSPEPFADIETGGGATTTTTVADDGDATTTTTPTTRNPAEVKVLVANGTSVAGAAGRTQDQLAAQGYNVLAAVQSTESGVEASVVFFAEGFEAEAAELAAQFDPVPVVQPLTDTPPVDDLRGADVLVVLGQDIVRSG